MPSPVPADRVGVTAYLTVNNAADAMEWYREVFDATEIYHHTGPGGKYIHLEMSIGGGVMMLADDFPEMGGGTSNLPEAIGGSPVTLHIYVPDVDQVFDKALALGATESVPVSEMFWGDRFGKFTDPYGHVWSVATKVKDMTPQEMEAAAQNAFGGGG